MQGRKGATDADLRICMPPVRARVRGARSLEYRPAVPELPVGRPREAAVRLCHGGIDGAGSAGRRGSMRLVRPPGWAGSLRVALSRRIEAPMELRRVGDSNSGLLCTAAQVLRSGLSRRIEAPMELRRVGDSNSGLLCTTAQVLRSGLSRRIEAPMKLRRVGDSNSGLLCTAAQVLRSGLSRRIEAPMELRRVGDSNSGLLCTAAQVLRPGLRPLVAAATLARGTTS